MLDAIWCGNNIYTIWLDEKRTEQYDAKYVLHFERWYNVDGQPNTWPTVPIWENTIEEIRYVSETVVFEGNTIENTRSYPTLKPEVVNWCNDVIGPHGKEWGIPRPNLVTHPSIHKDRGDWVEFIGSTSSYGVYFRLKRSAMLFKLTWS